MTFLITCGFRGFRFRSLSIRSSTDTDLRRVDVCFDIIGIVLLDLIFLGISVYERFLDGDIFDGGFGCVLAQISKMKMSSNNHAAAYQLMIG